MDWTAKLVDILGPDYGYNNNDITGQMTLKDLLSHRSGAPGLVLSVMAGYPKQFSRKTISK